jgi:ABC-type phosphate transport system substrate-binding protein
MKKLSLLAALLVAIAATSGSAGAQDFKIVANNSVAASSLGADVLAKLFLKQTGKFPDGAAATPVYESKSSATRIAFDKAILGKSVAGVETYWQQQIFSGKDVPPASKNTDDDVITFVKATPGGIGYVSAGATVAGVKIISIK